MKTDSNLKIPLSLRCYLKVRITYPKSQVVDLCLRRLNKSCVKGSIYRDVASERRGDYCLCNKQLMRQKNNSCDKVIVFFALVGVALSPTKLTRVENTRKR